MITEQEIREAFPIIKQADTARLADVANANGIDLETLKSAIESAARAIAYVADLVREACGSIRYHYTATLREIATPKEWHLMHHAQRRRTRQKYENRLNRRMQTLLGGRCT